MAEVILTDFLKSIAQSPENTRLALAKQLKKAGLYRGTPSKDFNTNLLNALKAAEEQRVQIVAVRGPVDRFAFIDELAKQGETSDKGQPSAVTSRTVSDPSALFADIDAVTREYFGGELPDAAKEQLAQKYVAMQKAGKMDVTTSYNADGSFRQTTGGGQTPQQFFIQQISNSDEARANRVLQGYDTIMRLLGGLR